MMQTPLKTEPWKLLGQRTQVDVMDVEKEIRRMAKALLKRHPLRRGPFIFDERWLKRIVRR